MRLAFARENIQEAVDFWNDGYDTLQIAEFFGVHEAMIYSCLPRWRQGLKLLEAA